ncbi:hypothetical protein L249_2398 [Ophiocordyceps polyrhachis-furcata BCC 54312]|uniref:Uncharacterized protein n=1 Tax=Ophiocordyceps polyrhachis-furcata BCC 54312 TaxID=1330021 RepID=A0A367LPY5_9HYPO|nr:hypothetical protein L249_2398 [Ophiocordyceps polyrhachis-furcata BCC 54312]
MSWLDYVEQAENQMVMGIKTRRDETEGTMMTMGYERSNSPSSKKVDQKHVKTPLFNKSQDDLSPGLGLYFLLSCFLIASNMKKRNRPRIGHDRLRRPVHRLDGAPPPQQPHGQPRHLVERIPGAHVEAQVRRGDGAVEVPDLRPQPGPGALPLEQGVGLLLRRRVGEGVAAEHLVDADGLHQEHQRRQRLRVARQPARLRQYLLDEREHALPDGRMEPLARHAAPEALRVKGHDEGHQALDPEHAPELDHGLRRLAARRLESFEGVGPLVLQVLTPLEQMHLLVAEHRHVSFEPRVLAVG